MVDDIPIGSPVVALIETATYSLSHDNSSLSCTWCKGYSIWDPDRRQNCKQKYVCGALPWSLNKTACDGT